MSYTLRGLAPLFVLSSLFAASAPLSQAQTTAATQSAQSASPVVAMQGDLSLTIDDLVVFERARGIENPEFVDARLLRARAEALLGSRMRLRQIDKLGFTPLQKQKLAQLNDLALEEQVSNMVTETAQMQVQQSTTPAQLEARARELYAMRLPELRKDERMEAAHIAVLLDKHSPEEVARRIGEAHERLKKGEAFETVAQALSEDTVSAKDGGKLPLFTRRDVDRLFGRAVFGTEHAPGTLVGPFFSHTGAHIVKIVGKRPAEAPSFESLKDELMEEAVKSLVETKRAELWAKINEPQQTFVFKEELVAPLIQERLSTEQIEQALKFYRENKKAQGAAAQPPAQPPAKQP